MVELHCHLDGSITAEIAKKLAAHQNISLPVSDDKQLENMLSVGDDCQSLTEFLKCFDLPDLLLQSKEGIKEAVKLILAGKKEIGVEYMELRFAPQLHCKKGLSQEDAIKAVLEAINESQFMCNVILCLMRGENTHESNMETIELAKKYLVKTGGIVAVDLAGAEALFPTADYQKEFAKASEYGLPFTIHSGEADGIASLKKAIEFGTKRIGHGIRLTEDEELLDYVAKNGITLEMCPTSNKITKAVPDMRKYPLRLFMEKGIKVTISTDDPAICRTNMKKEFEYLKKEFNLTAEEERQLNLNAIDAAFTTDEVKAQLRKKYL